MAKVMFADTIVGMSGSTAGATYSRNRYGAYRRYRAIPTNPDSPAQQAVRAILAAFAQGWRVLTQSQRDAWDGAVNNFIGTDVFANTKRLTGSALYTRLNATLASVGSPAISAPPLPVAVPSAATGAIVIATGVPTYTVAFTAAGPTKAFQLFATPPVSAGVSYVKNLYKQIAVIPGGGPSPYDFEADYIAVYGVPPIGTKVFLKIVCVDIASGITGVATSNYAVVTT